MIEFSDLLLAQAMPEVDAKYVIGVVSRVCHIAGAIILGGGLFYMKAVLAPKGADACFADRRSIWAKWVGVAIFLLLLSGFYNFITIINAAKAAGAKLPPTYHMLFGVKFLLGLLVMFIASILAGKTSAAERFREKMSKWLSLGWASVLAIVVIAAILRTLHS